MLARGRWGATDLKLDLSLTPAIAVVEKPPGAANARDWDGFAEACGASTRSSLAHMTNRTAKSLGRYRRRLFEIHLADNNGLTKVGQCGVGHDRARKRFVFLDRLQLLPSHDEIWGAVMAAVLQQTGAGHYEYGWALNLEPARDADLVAIGGVEIADSRPLVVQAVDFSKWANWESYRQGLSENSRRNAKAALKNYKHLTIDTRTGVSSILSVATMLRLRADLAERKGLGVRKLSALVSYVATILSCPQYMMTSVVIGDGRKLSCFYGAEFGTNTYYFEGASAPGNGGGAWHLLIAMLQRAYERAPDGKFVMGYVDYALHDDEVSAGLLRSRQACRVSDYATSIVKFSYAPR